MGKKEVQSEIETKDYEVSVHLHREITLDEKDKMTASVTIKKLTNSADEDLGELWNKATNLMDDYYKDQISCSEETCKEETCEEAETESSEVEEEQKISEESINGMSKEELVELCGQIPELSEIDTNLKIKSLKALVIDTLFSDESPAEEEAEEETQLTEEDIQGMKKADLIELCGQIPELSEIDTNLKEKTLKALIIDTLFSEEEVETEEGGGEYKDTDWDD